MIFKYLFLLCFLFSQEELVDGVLAVVGDKKILFSEVLGETRMAAERKGINPQSSPMLFQNRLRHQDYRDFFKVCALQVSNNKNIALVFVFLP